MRKRCEYACLTACRNWPDVFSYLISYSYGVYFNCFRIFLLCLSLSYIYTTNTTTIRDDLHFAVSCRFFLTLKKSQRIKMTQKKNKPKKNKRRAGIFVQSNNYFWFFCCCFFALFCHFFVFYNHFVACKKKERGYLILM